MSGRERQKIDFSFWFARIGYDVNASYLQSAKSDQFVIVSSGCSIGIDIIAISQKRPIAHLLAIVARSELLFEMTI
jgi:hypothetical protein